MADDHKGLRAAARRVFDATQQRCRVHSVRNAPAHVPPKSRAAVAAMLKTIFAQDIKAEAQTQWHAVAEALREKQDKRGAIMDASREDALADMNSPKEHWAQMVVHSCVYADRTSSGQKVLADIKEEAADGTVKPRKT